MLTCPRQDEVIEGRGSNQALGQRTPTGLDGASAGHGGAVEPEQGRAATPDGDHNAASSSTGTVRRQKVTAVPTLRAGPFGCTSGDQQQAMPHTGAEERPHTTVALRWLSPPRGLPSSTGVARRQQAKHIGQAIDKRGEGRRPRRCSVALGQGRTATSSGAQHASQALDEHDG